jgi:hypothetical protein
VNQPKTIYDDDNESLGSTDVFDAPTGPPPEKPLLAAALKARAQAETQRSAAHLSKVNQPRTIYEDDDDSLGSTELFDAQTGPPPEKPLLAAALKARARAETQRSAAHLSNVNQPKTIYEDDDDSLGSTDLFDIPTGPPPEKPLLAAALKARAQAKTQRSAAHLSNANQPKTIYEDDNESIGSTDLFDAPTGPPSEKPLLAAALKARAQAEQSQSSQSEPLHAKKLSGAGPTHRNANVLENDKGRLNLAKQKSRHSKSAPSRSIRGGDRSWIGRSGSKTLAPSHLVDVKQPEILDDDDNSLGIDDVFDPPRPPPTKKPLLAAALKAKEARLKEEARASSKKIRASTSSGILKKRHSSEKRVSSTNDQSLTMDGVFGARALITASPKRRSSRPTPILSPEHMDYASGVSRPMSAKMVRMNSIDKGLMETHSQDEHSAQSPVQSPVGSPKKSKKSTKRRSSTSSDRKKASKSPSKPSKRNLLSRMVGKG